MLFLRKAQDNIILKHGFLFRKGTFGSNIIFILKCSRLTKNLQNHTVILVLMLILPLSVFPAPGIRFPFIK